MVVILKLHMDINTNGKMGLSKTHCLQACASLKFCMLFIATMHWLRMAKHQQGPVVHSPLLIFDRHFLTASIFSVQSQLSV